MLSSQMVLCYDDSVVLFTRVPVGIPAAGFHLAVKHLAHYFKATGLKLLVLY